MSSEDDELERTPVHLQRKEKDLMTVDEVLNDIGFGYKQFILLAFFCFLHLSFCYQTLIMYYTGDSPSWQCISNNSSRFCANNYGKTFDKSNDDFYKRCDLLRSEWKFTTSLDYSIVTEYDLICSKEYLNALVNALFFIGWGVCGVFTSIIADKYGRKITMVLCLFSVAFFAILSVYVTALWQFAVLRFILGGSAGSMTSLLFIYTSELAPPKFRSLFLNTVQLWTGISIILLSVLAMYLPRWRELQLYATVPSVLAFIIILILPASPRWLLSVGRKNQAESVLMKLNHSKKKNQYSLLDVSNTKEKKKYSYTDLLFHKLPITLFVLAQAFLFMSAGLVYYGLSMESSDLGGNMYENLMLSMISDSVGNIAAIFVCDIFGRKKTTIGSFALCSVFLACIDAVPHSSGHGTLIRLILAMLGKVFSDLAFSCLYLYSIELFPTVVRTQGLQICQIGSRIGSSSAPFVTSVLRRAYLPLPFIIMATCSLLAAITGFYLPETHKRPTRERFEDILYPPTLTFNEDRDTESLLESS